MIRKQSLSSRSRVLGGRELGESDFVSRNRGARLVTPPEFPFFGPFECAAKVLHWCLGVLDAALLARPDLALHLVPELAAHHL